MNIDILTGTEQLIGEQKELAETIGLEAYRKLIANYGGNPVYIPKVETVLKEIREREIKENFNGKNYRELSKKYGISEMTVRRIVSVKL